MDFIERWIGVSPDGGNGSLEVIYLLVIVIALAGIALRGRIHRLVRRRF